MITVPGNPNAKAPRPQVQPKYLAMATAVQQKLLEANSNPPMPNAPTSPSAS